MHPIRLRDIGEDALIERLTAALPLGPEVVVGAGDDCAVLRTPDPEVYSLLKTDCLVEGVHFSRDSDPEKVGWKCLCRSLSDIAAMAGTPRAALVTLAASPDHQIATIEGWYRGLRRAAEQYQVSIVGGETSSLPDGADTALLSLMLTGEVSRERCVYRHGAHVGDLIAVTGRLGGSLASGRHLDFVPRLTEARWLAETLRPTAMMDLSDGLAKDLPRLAKAGGKLGWRIDLDSLPCHQGCDPGSALGDGEDYELLLTLDPAFFGEQLAEWDSTFPDLPLTLIGEITPTIETALTGGWEHFAKP